MKILLVDDHELFREGVKLLLTNLSESLEFAEAQNCASALECVEREHFDLILLDFHLPGMHGLPALKALREKAEDAAIIVLSGEEDPALIRQLVDAGAAGFIPKTSTHAVMMAAMRLILAGGTYLPPHALNANLEDAPPTVEPGSALSALSPRQLNTLKHAILGKANKTIARELGISEATVKAHLSVAYRALGVNNRTEAVFAAARAGLKTGRSQPL